MILESLLLFETIVAEDRSILELIDADYAYLNSKLIRHYGLEQELAGELRGMQRRNRDG